MSRRRRRKGGERGNKQSKNKKKQVLESHSGFERTLFQYGTSKFQGGKKGKTVDLDEFPYVGRPYRLVELFFTLKPLPSVDEVRSPLIDLFLHDNSRPLCEIVSNRLRYLSPFDLVTFHEKGLQELVVSAIIHDRYYDTNNFFVFSELNLPKNKNLFGSKIFGELRRVENNRHADVVVVSRKKVVVFELKYIRLAYCKELYDLFQHAKSKGLRERAPGLIREWRKLTSMSKDVKIKYYNRDDECIENFRNLDEFERLKKNSSSETIKDQAESYRGLIMDLLKVYSENERNREEEGEVEEEEVGFNISIFGGVGLVDQFRLFNLE